VDAEGRFEPQALVVVQRKPLPADDGDVWAALCSAGTPLTLQLCNDAYAKYAATLPASTGAAAVDVLVTHPAAPEDLAHHMARPERLVEETPAAYREGLARTIAAAPPERLQWVWNILSGAAEADRVLYRTADDAGDDGFVVLPSLTWEVGDVRGVHCLVLTTRRDVATLRDLRRVHLPLLLRVWTEGRAAVSRATGVPVARLRAFVHYPPSTYHLHIHIAALDGAGASVAPERTHLLPDVIDNLVRYGDGYYANKTMHVLQPEDDQDTATGA
jgi:m7GpppX diphosphatase